MTLLFIIFGLVVNSAGAVAIPAAQTNGLQCFGAWQPVMVKNTEGPGTLTFSDATGPIGSIRVASQATILGCVPKTATYTWKAE